MASTLQVEVVSPEGSLFSGKANRVFASAEMGEVGILPKHAPFLSPLKPGVITIESGDEEDILYVSGGILEVQPDQVSILADTVIRAEDIDVKEAEKAKKRAEDALKSAHEKMDIDAAQMQVIKALAQIQTYAKYRDSAQKRGLMR